MSKKDKPIKIRIPIPRPGYASSPTKKGDKAYKRKPKHPKKGGGDD